MSHWPFRPQHFRHLAANQARATATSSKGLATNHEAPDQVFSWLERQPPH